MLYIMLIVLFSIYTGNVDFGFTSLYEREISKQYKHQFNGKKTIDSKEFYKNLCVQQN